MGFFRKCRWKSLAFLEKKYVVRECFFFLGTRVKKTHTKNTQPKHTDGHSGYTRLTEDVLNEKHASLKVQPSKKGPEQYLGPDFWKESSRMAHSHKVSSSLKQTSRVGHIEAQLEAHLKRETWCVVGQFFLCCFA